MYVVREDQVRPRGSVRVKAPDTARPPATGDEAWRRAGGGQPSPRRKRDWERLRAAFRIVGMRSEPGGMGCDAMPSLGSARDRRACTDTCGFAREPGRSEGKRSRVGAFDVTGEPGVSDVDAQRG